MTRIFQPIHLAVGITIPLDERGSHYLGRVLRVVPGEHLIIFNGEGMDYQAVITSCKKNQVEVKIIGEALCQTESPMDFHLAQGIARGSKMDLIIQKAVELGVSKIFPISMKRTQGNKRENEEARIKHWQAIAISACEQCGRSRIPTIERVHQLEEWLIKKPQLTYALDPHSEGFVKKIDSPPSSIGLLIGPEGGLSPTELKLAITAGCHPLHLGPRILRTETAALAALAILQFYYGDM